MKIDQQLKFAIIPGTPFDLDTDENGSSRVIVTGSDYDAVLAGALNVKNVLPVERCPEVGEVLLDSSDGRWRAQVRTRRSS